MLARSSTLVLAILSHWLLTVDDQSVAADWPHWQGPHRDGSTAESSQFSSGRWFDSEPEWSVEVGEGGTSPLVANGKLFSFGWADGKENVSCLDARDGTFLWQKSYPAPQYGRFAVGDQGVYSGPSATPELDPLAGLLYTLGCDGELRCWAISDGELVWRKNLYDKYEVTQRPEIKDRPRERRIGRTGLRDYGYTTAPLVIDGQVLVEVGSGDALIMAFDGRTGSEIWRSERGGHAGHTGGLVPIQTSGGPAVAVLSLRELAVVGRSAGGEGKTVAIFPWESGFANNVQTPAISDQSLFVTSYHSHRAISRLDLEKSDAPPEARLTDVWQAGYSSRVGSPVVDGNYVYLAGPELYCLDKESGRLLWKGGAFAEGASIVACGDDRLILLGSQGNLVVAESGSRSSERYVELASLPLNKIQPGNAEWWPHVILAEGHLYAKDRQGRLLCLGKQER